MVGLERNLNRKRVQIEFGMRAIQRGLMPAINDMNLYLATCVMDLKLDDPKRKMVLKYLGFSKEQWQQLFWQCISENLLRKQIINEFQSRKLLKEEWFK